MIWVQGLRFEFKVYGLGLDIWFEFIVYELGLGYRV